MRASCLFVRSYSKVLLDIFGNIVYGMGRR